jgi:hypothetical protein
MNLVTVYTALNPADAHRVRAQLDAAGFHPVILHELSALSFEGYTLGAGGILVQVPDAEADDAKALLEAPDESVE